MGNQQQLYDMAVRICVAAGRGEDITALAAQIEPELKRFHKREHISGMNLCYPQDALWDVSAGIRRYWDHAYETFERPEDRYEALIRFVNAREKYLGAPHEDSVRRLRGAGWTPADIMAAYLHQRCGCSMLPPLSPDVVAHAAREDMDTARLLLNGDKYDQFFPSYGKGYNVYKHFEWIDFLYYFLEYEDRTFLTAKHKSKRLCAHCEHVREVIDGLAKPAAAAAQAAPTAPATDLPDFSVFCGAPLQQKHLLASAARQKLRKGNEQDGYYVKSYHLLDEEQGCGAALCFEAVNRGPDYGAQTVAAEGVYFYRFTYPILFDYIPESRRCAPRELPEAFVKRAFVAFSGAAGLRRAKKP